MNLTLRTLVFVANTPPQTSKEKSDLVDYLFEYNKILKSKLESKGKIKFTKAERARLARKGHKIKWKVLNQISDF